jgi:hypothetical protein
LLLYGKIEEPFNQGKRTDPIPKFSHPSFGREPNILYGILRAEHWEQIGHKLKAIHPSVCLD